MGTSLKKKRIPARTVFTSGTHFLAFGFGSGLAPFAPGTFGSIVGVIVWFGLCWLPITSYIVVISLMFVAGCAICGVSARRLRVHDHGGIVFDEIVGMLIAAMPLLWETEDLAIHMAASFALFRLFDIWKPWPIRWLDRHVRGGAGIMVDDVLAGLYAAGMLILTSTLAHDLMLDS